MITKRTGIIYRAIFPSNKVYIGQTIRGLKVRVNDHHYDAFNENRRDHNSKMSRAIRKYGKENITWDVLYKNVLQGNLDNLEIKAISYYDSFNNGYNLTTGGNVGYTRSTKNVKKNTRANARKKHTKEAKQKMSKAHMGKKHTEESKQKMSKQRSGEKAPGAKLNWGLVREIRVKHKIGKYTQQKLSEEYNITNQAISKIINYKSWKIPLD